MRKLNRNQEEYVEWLYFDVLKGPESRFKAYISLVRTLYTIPFRWVHPMDKNRYMDALYMRNEYYYIVDDEISVLEVLIALSVRMEKDIMAPAMGENDYFRWFWGMIEHLELDEFDENNYDEGWILKIIDAFLDRKYDKNGENGGLFPLHFCNRDAREMEIWDQMNEYLVENWV